ncbi:MAG: hypothetical protein A2869_04810, partial [Candidatus Levybacteria bacterium RIFCSPHIGHO2_01_FULL_40_58]
LTVTGTLTANGILDANGVVTLGDGGDAVTIDSNALILQTTGADTDITINAVDQIILTDFTTCTALETVANVLTCGTDDTGGGTNFWATTNGLLHAGNETVDFAIGATATSSAEFAVTGINDGTPTATISATAGGSAGNGISLTGSTATIQSLQMGTLTLGGLTTGNIVIDSGSSSITLSDATTASSSLTVSGTLTANGLFDANGQVDLGDGGDTFSLASTTIDITAGAVSGVTTLSLSGAITDSDSAVTINDDLTITTGTTISATSITTLNCTDCIDFDDIANTATVDETTDINLGTGIDLFIDMTDTGTFAIRDVATAYWTFDDDSTVDVLFPAAGQITIDSAATDSTITTGVINLDVDAGNAAVIGLDLNIESITGITAATDITGQKITILQNDDDADHFGLTITNAATSLAGTLTDDIECLLCLDNAENTAGVVTDAIRITSSGIAAGITNDINLQNGETIRNSTDGTIALTDGTNTLLSVVDQGAYGTVRLSNKGSIGDPASCTAGDIYFNGTDATVKACTATDTWEALDGGVGSTSVQVYTSSTSWSKPAGLLFARVMVVGAGGGGGGADTASLYAAGGGGGGGGYSEEWFTASALGSSETVTVGTGGTAGSTAGGNGGTGVTSSFGTSILLSATGGGGGGGGLNDSIGVGGTGGSGSGGNVNLAGGAGGPAVIDTNSSDLRGGSGGNSARGGGGLGGAGDAAGATGGVYGGGAGGAAEDDATGQAGGVGGAGIVIVYEYIKTTGADYAEWYETKEDVEAGDLVTPSHESFSYNTTEGLETIAVLEKARIGSALLGIVSAAPSEVIGGELAQAGRNPRPIALAGRVPLKVSIENGPIKVGDSITSSSTPGVGMKATKAGRVIGVALEPYDSDGIGKIIVFVNPSWYDPDIYIADNGSLIIVNQGTDKDPLFAVQKQESDEPASIVDRIAAFSEVIAANVSAGLLNAKKVETDSLSATNSAFLVSNIQDLTSNNATLSGTLSAEKIRASSIELINSDLDFSKLDEELSEIERKLSVLESLGLFNTTPLSTDSAFLTRADNLMVSGSTTLADVAVLNSLSVGNNLTIGSNAINTLAGDLEIQPLSQGAVRFLGGAVIIEEDGKLKVEENAEFAKNVSVSGVLSAKDIAIKRAEEVQIISQTEVVATGSSALVTLPSGQTELKVNNEIAKTESAIFITPKTELSQPLYIKTQSDGQFTVGIKEGQVNDIDFNFLIVN